MKKILFIIAALVAVVVAAPQTHDGFFLNSAVGVGYFGLDYNYDTDIRGEDYSETLEYGGSGVQFDFKVGGRVIGNFLLHLSITSIMKRGDVDRSATFAGETIKIKDNGLLEEFFFGIGGTYYLPSNVFVTGSFGVADFTLGGNDLESDDGFAFQIGAGKEWWVSAEWGFGVEVVFMHSKGSNGDGESASANTLSILFSTTFN